ncbi:MAG: hypothetical protein HYR51_00440 [Candidatus Rokubacteria bacterium]|nr:hypothetical protein [Candidatus Rokubacteria bacterium]
MRQGLASNGEEFATGDPAFAAVNTRSAVGVGGGALRLFLVTHGAAAKRGVAPANGRLGAGTWAYGEGATVHAVRAHLRVADVVVESCGADESRSRAQIVAYVGSSYWDEQPLVASLSLERRGASGDRVIAVVSRCRDRLCSIADDVDWVVFARSWAIGVNHVLTIRHEPDARRFVFTVYLPREFARSWATGVPHRLAITWLPAESRVRFAVSGGDGAGETRGIPYTSVPVRAVGYVYELRVQSFGGSCWSTYRPFRMTTDARFDNVRIETAAP